MSTSRKISDIWATICTADVDTLKVVIDRKPKEGKYNTLYYDMSLVGMSKTGESLRVPLNGRITAQNLILNPIKAPKEGTSKNEQAGPSFKVFQPEKSNIMWNEDTFEGSEIINKHIKTVALASAKEHFAQDDTAAFYNFLKVANICFNTMYTKAAKAHQAFNSDMLSAEQKAQISKEDLENGELLFSGNNYSKVLGSYVYELADKDDKTKKKMVPVTSPWVTVHFKSGAEGATGTTFAYFAPSPDNKAIVRVPCRGSYTYFDKGVKTEIPLAKTDDIFKVFSGVSVGKFEGEFNILKSSSGFIFRFKLNTLFFWPPNRGIDNSNLGTEEEIDPSMFAASMSVSHEADPTYESES